MTTMYPDTEVAEMFNSIVEENQDFANSALQRYRYMPTSSKGKAFENVFESIMTTKKGLVVESRTDTGHDRIVDGVKVEIKGAFLGKSGIFVWNQIKPHQDWDVLVLMAFYPSGLRMFAATKNVAKRFLEVQDEDGLWTYNQHGGKRTNSGAFWLQGLPEDFPWLVEVDDVWPDR